MSTTHNERPEGIHKSQIVIVLVLASISALFAGLSAAYLYTMFQVKQPIPYPPPIFYITVVLLFAATRFMVRGNDQMKSGNVDGYLKFAMIGFGLTVVFGVIQVVGWVTFFTGDMAIVKSQALAFLFALSALHHLHVIAGLPFLGKLLYRINRENKDGIALRPTNSRTMRSITLYWRYVDVLWILLVAMLFISAAVS